MPNSPLYSWMTEKEQEEYLLGGKVKQEAAAAQTAAWLRGELNTPQEERYLASQYNMQPTKNSLANTTRPLKDLAGLEKLLQQDDDAFYGDLIVNLKGSMQIT